MSGSLRAAAGVLLRPFWARVIMQIERQLQPLREDVADQRARHDDRHRTLTARLGEQGQRMDHLEGWLRDIQARVDLAEAPSRLIAAQVSALEQRVSTLTEQAGDHLAPVANGELEQAKSVLDEVRTEHARVRARLTAVARYEERIGRLEQAFEN